MHEERIRARELANTVSHLWRPTNAVLAWLVHGVANGRAWDEARSAAHGSAQRAAWTRTMASLKYDERATARGVDYDCAHFAAKAAEAAAEAAMHSAAPTTDQVALERTEEMAQLAMKLDSQAAERLSQLRREP